MVDIDQLTERLARTKVSDIQISRKLIGFYNWDESQSSTIYIPGFPQTLRKNCMSLKLPTLSESPMPKEESHPNEYLHNTYFEPVQEVLKHHHEPLFEFDILTDRNNLRKLDSALQNTSDYEDFIIYLKKKDNLLILKRKELKYGGNRVGIEFEERLCEPYDFFSCHAIVAITVETKEKKTRLCVRSEIDAMTANSPKIELKEYTKVEKTENGLKVKKSAKELDVKLENLREIKMAKVLKDTTLFQSWLVGVPKIVHGVHVRFESRVRDDESYHKRLAAILQLLDKYRAKMEEDKVYVLRRNGSNPIEFEEVKISGKWLA